jgi:hypothetical protein
MVTPLPLPPPLPPPVPLPLPFPLPPSLQNAHPPSSQPPFSASSKSRPSFHSFLHGLSACSNAAVAPRYDCACPPAAAFASATAVASLSSCACVML